MFFADIFLIIAKPIEKILVEKNIELSDSILVKVLLLKIAL